jgi:glycerol dehydrogenase
MLVYTNSNSVTRSFVSPSQYIQGTGTLDELGAHAAGFGNRALLITDDVVENVLGERVPASFSSADVDHHTATFGGECTEAEISRLTAVGQRTDADVIVGMGGGKVIDVAKAVRGRNGGCLITAPTIASTDAPTSGLSVVYTDDGNIAGGIVHDQRPDLVLVDTGVIAAAPVRWFVSGVGDALATRFEAEATLQTSGWTFAGGDPSQAGLALARRCYDVVHAHAPAAVNAVGDNTVTDAVEETVEAIVLLSGLGFENGGLAAAHAIHDGIVSAAETTATHGEKVCFGLLAQLQLEGRPTDEIRDVAEFAHGIGLPITLEDLGIPSARLDAIAEVTCTEGSTMDNQPGDPTPHTVSEALVAADRLGRAVSEPNADDG